MNQMNKMAWVKRLPEVGQPLLDRLTTITQSEQAIEKLQRFIEEESNRIMDKVTRNWDASDIRGAIDQEEQAQAEAAMEEASHCRCGHEECGAC